MEWDMMDECMACNLKHSEPPGSCSIPKLNKNDNLLRVIPIFLVDAINISCITSRAVHCLVSQRNG
ncbi:hypothetical protein E2C01_052275 [Portunus trituberculatus]|uniref:Uncharacterized protein n=1 Tax=Portunus trituberculatus TaxID=210409 RepID=A0A5B7GL45_PORTR|nr:hypothetical protein [Portunus trituberculatus]